MVWTIEPKALRTFCWITIFLCLMGFVQKAYSQDEGFKKYSGQWLYDQCKKDLEKKEFRNTACSNFLIGYYIGYQSATLSIYSNISIQEQKILKDKIVNTRGIVCFRKDEHNKTERLFANTIVKALENRIYYTKQDASPITLEADVKTVLSATLSQIYPCEDKVQEK